MDNSLLPISLNILSKKFYINEYNLPKLFKQAYVTAI